MLPSPSTSTDPELLVDHVNEHGPRVTHIRGTMIVNSRDSLREVGVYERYAELLPASHRDTLLYCLAASWLPIEDAQVHYQTCDQLMLEPTQFARIGEITSSRVVGTFLGAAVRVVRNAGIDSYLPLLKQNDRMYDRLYKGGGVRVYRVGPKDILLENFGQPLVASRYWRNAYLAYMEALANTFARVGYVKLVRPRSNDGLSIAVTGSWV